MSSYTVSVALNGQDNLSPVLSEAENNLQDMENTSGDAAGGLDSIATAAIGMGVAWVAANAVGMISDLSNIGDQANDAQDVFYKLAGGTDQANQMLLAMRSAAGGVISDLDLEKEAASALNQNLVHSSDQMSDLIKIGSEMGATMHMSATQGVDVLMNSLASGRVTGLKEIGLDTEAVTKRMDELKASGLGAMDAMRQATFEQGTQQLQRLGNAAHVGQDEIDKLGVNIANLKTEVGQGVNVIVNVVAGGANDLLFGNAAEEAAKAQIETFAHANAVAYNDKFFNDTDELFAQATNAETFFTPEYSQKVLESLFSNMKAEPNKDLQQVVQDTIMPLNLSDEAQQILAGQLYGMGKLQQQTEEVAKSQHDQAAAMAEQVRQQGLLNSAQQLADQDRTQSIQTQHESLDLMHQHNDATIEYSNAIAQVGNQLLAITNQGDAMSSLYTAKITAEQANSMLPDFMSDDQATAIANQFQQAEDELTRLHDMADHKLITDDQLTQASNMTTNLGLLADQAQKAADNFDHMSLSTALGTDKVDQMGSELSKMILDKAASEGMDKSQLDKLKDTLALSTGQETETSQALADTVTPQLVDIYKTAGADAAALAQKNVEEYLKQANLLGLSDDQKAAGLPGATGFTTDNKAKYGLGGGDNYVQQDMGFDPVKYAQSLTDTSDKVLAIATDSKTVGDNMVEVNTQFANVDNTAASIQSKILDMASRVHVVTIDLHVNGIEQLNAINTATGGSSGSSGNSTQQNGGRPSGWDARAN